MPTTRIKMGKKGKHSFCIMQISPQEVEATVFSGNKNIVNKLSSFSTADDWITKTINGLEVIDSDLELVV